MVYSVIQTAEFETDYDRALSYLTVDLGSMAAARRPMDEVERIASILGTTPFINAVSEKEYLANRGLREHFFMSYVIVYKVEDDVVILVDLFHQTQNYNSMQYWRE